MKVRSAENPAPSKNASFKPEVGQNIALHASPTARNSAFFKFQPAWFIQFPFLPVLL